jgi:acyl-CoA thioesterase YciA
MTEPYLALKVVMMPRDTNPQGTIFGGVILSHIDAAGAIGAIHEIKKAGGRVPGIVTVAMNKVEFHHPVFVGDVVSFLTHVVRLGQKSITMQISVEVERAGATLKVTAAEVVYVTVEVGPSGYKPVAIMPSSE